jgi:hypothetical protein
MTIVLQPVSSAAPPSLTGGQRSRCEPAGAAGNRLQIGKPGCRCAAGKLHSSMLMSSIEPNFNLFGSGFAGLRGSPVINRCRSAWPHAAIRINAGSKDTNLEIKTKHGFSSGFSQNEKCTGQNQAPPAKPEARFEPLKAVGGVTPVLNADLRGQKPTLAEQLGVGQRFYRRFSAFQNTELSNSLSPPAEPGVYQCNHG